MPNTTLLDENILKKYMKLIFFLTFYFSYFLSVSGQAKRGNVSIDQIMQSHYNEDIDLGIARDVRIFDSNGHIQDIRYIATIYNEPFSIIDMSSGRYDNKDSLQKILNYFQNSRKDWLSNCLLYYISCKNALFLSIYKDKINKWKKIRKKEDYKYWSEYILKL